MQTMFFQNIGLLLKIGLRILINPEEKGIKQLNE